MYYKTTTKCFEVLFLQFYYRLICRNIRYFLKTYKSLLKSWKLRYDIKKMNFVYYKCLLRNRQLSVCCVFRCLVINCIELVSLFIGLNRDLLLFSTHCAPCSINTSASPFLPPLPPVDGRAVSFSSCRSPSISRGLQSAPLCHTRCLWYNFSSLKKKGLKNNGSRLLV